ncbi:hypothetical protein GQ44DRAFT_763768 [Phaeosphaeriaceae sp. PMI808]|nr:hypothetical protein GQ44DRAFT_763768 [Phaeosphaeriaceae sp. PMI808]
MKTWFIPTAVITREWTLRSTIPECHYSEMSGFGISLADILKLLKGCVWLKERFDKNNAADHRLQEFINDINLLERRLRRLLPALEDALERYEDPDGDVDAIELRCDLGSLVGDIEQTLLEAQELATSHIKIHRNAAGFIHNVIWAAHAEPKVDSLRKAMQFHAQKIFLVMEPVNLRLLTTIDVKIDKMDEKLDILLGITAFSFPELPGWLDTMFRDAILVDMPSPFNHVNKIPLSQGFDALYLHYRESTHAFRDSETAEQTVEQYLNLLKCQWLLNILREGEQFKRGGSLYPRVLKQIEQRLIREHQRSDIVRYSEAEIRAVNATAFRIWPIEQVVDVETSTQASSGEHIILRLSLPNSGGEDDLLVIFRTGPTTLRIAKRSFGRDGIPYYESEHFNIHQDVFTPFYAIAENVASNRQSIGTTLQASPSISIYRGNATGAVNYRLGSDADVFAFQRAITGYQVVFDKSVSWAIKESGIRGQLARGQGRMQIWHWKPFEEVVDSDNQVISPTLSAHSMASYASTTSDAVVGTLLERRSTSGITVDERSAVGSVICATTPPHPVVVIYNKENEVYTYYHMELDFGLQIVSSSCPCESESKKDPKDWICQRSVIERRNKKDSRLSFTTRTLSVHRNDLSIWNLGVFAQPRHPLFNNKRVCQESSIDFLNVDFASVADRVEFKRKFQKALELRNKAEVEHQEIVKITNYLGEKNGRPPPPISTRRPSRVDSMNPLARVPERSPMLRPLSPVSVFRMNDYRVKDSATTNWKRGSRTNMDKNSCPSPSARSSTSGAFGRWSCWIDRMN